MNWFNDDTIEDVENVYTLNPLLDIDNYSGESSKRMAPIIIFLLLEGVPWVLYIYFFYGRIPIKYFIYVYIYYAIRIALITLGKEGQRKIEFLRIVYEIYSDIKELLQIQEIHQDGLVQYESGQVSYYLVAIHNSHINILNQATQLGAFFKRAGKDFCFDLYVQNVVDDVFYNRYDAVDLFADPEMATDFLETVDYNRKYVTEQNKLNGIVLVFNARKSEWRRLQEELAVIIRSPAAKIFKELHVLKGGEIDDVINDDIDTYVNFDALQEEKYAKDEYYGAHVIGYDCYKDLQKYQQEAHKIELHPGERGFIIKEREVK